MKKVLALVIVVLLLAAMAAPMALADNVTVTVSVSVNGELVVAAEPVTTGEATVEGAIRAAHAAFYPDGEAGYASGIDATYNMFMINTCWGVQTTPYVILNSAPLATGENAAYTTADTAPIKNGDNIILIVDTTYAVPVASLTAEPDGGNVKITATAWTLDFMTFQYNGSPLANMELKDASGASLGTTGADGTLTVASTAKAVLPGVAAIPADGSATVSAAPAAGAPAAGGAAPASGDAITVYVTISANGVLGIAAQPVQITTYTVEEALKEAHRQYYPGGESGFAAGIDSTYFMYMINTIWGVQVTPYVILNTAPLGSGANAAYTTADTAPVADGDNIIVVADAAGAVPAISMVQDENGLVKVNQWALDFTTFQYTNGAVEEAEVVDAQTGEVLGKTNALGNCSLSKQPSCGVVAIKGVAACPVGEVQSFQCVQDAYVPPAHDYSIFGGPDGKSLLNIVIFGIGAIIPLLIIVIFAHNKEVKTGGVKYANLDTKAGSEVIRHM